MKLLRHVRAERLVDAERQLWGAGESGSDFGGCFRLASCDGGRELHVIASNGDGWDHVSVSAERGCPTWAEMEQVKRLFFRPEETAMQLHVPSADHINLHPHCLHMWRPHAEPIPRPPAEFV